MSQSLKTFNLNDELTLRQDKLFILLEISMEQKTNVYLYKKSYAI